MGHFWMELDAVEAAAFVLHGGDRGTASAGKNLKSLWYRHNLVAMAHPDIQQAITTLGDMVRDIVQQRAVFGHPNLGIPELTLVTGFDSPPALPPWSACRSRCQAPESPVKRALPGPGDCRAP